MSCSSNKYWKAAIDEELKSLHKNDTWNITDLPDGKKVLNTIWIFKTKNHANGSSKRFKARLVAKGCSQKKGN